MIRSFFFYSTGTPEIRNGFSDAGNIISHIVLEVRVRGGNGEKQISCDEVCFNYLLGVSKNEKIT